MKRLIVLVIAGLLISCSGEKLNTSKMDSSKTVLLEKVEQVGNEVVIPYEKYKLANGLTLIVHEDHSDPIVHVDVTYHVGSSREEINRSGFAHFFEHMMFQGSDNVADEEHFKMLSEAGGTLNGTTNSDRTNYFETLPSNQLELALWLEADRMGFLLDAVTQKKFENQRETVKNERGQRVDNRPYGKRGEMTSKALYPYGHGYAWPVIGWMKDLNAATVADLKKFFMRWYGPNNATLTVGGDIDVKQVIALVEKYFGGINPGPEVKMPEKPAVTLDKDRYVSYEDNVRFPLIQMTFPTIPVRHPDEAPLDLLSDILGSGKNSLFYQSMIKTQYALNAVVQHPCRELGGEFQFIALPNPRSGKTLADLEQLMRKALDDFEVRGVNDEDLLKSKVKAENRTISGLASVAGKVGTLAANNTFTNNPNYIKEDIRRYNDVTKEDVMRVYKKYIKGKASVILSVYQKGKPEQVAAADNFKVNEDASKLTKNNYAELKYKKAVDSFDRSIKPTPGKNPIVQVPDYWEKELSNGLKIIGTENTEIPTMFLQLSIKGGHHAESQEKSGLAALTAALMNETTKNFSNEAMGAELEKTGARITFNAGNNYTTLTVNSLTKYFDRTVELAKEKLFNPKFTQEDFDRVKNQQLQAIKQSQTDATATVSAVFNRLLYGEKHIMAKPSSGTLETLKSVTLDDVKEFYKNYYSPSVSNLVVVGSMKQDAVLAKINFLDSWAKKDVAFTKQPATPKRDKTKLFFVNKDKAAQSEIRVGQISLPFDATGDYYKAGLMNFTLGGAFNSRINLNLREDKGYTYGARSGFRGNHETGIFSAGAGVRANVSDSSLVELMNELKGFKSGITGEELEFMKSSIGQRDARKYETAGQKAGFLRQIIEYNLDKSFVKKQQEILSTMTKKEVDSLINELLNIEKMLILVVGDKEEVLEKLEKVGYGKATVLDTEGSEIIINL